MRKSFSEMHPELDSAEFLRSEYIDKRKSGSAIAAEVGCSCTVVYKRLRKYGIHRYAPSNAEIVALYEQGLSYRDIKRRLHIGEWSITRAIAELGAPRSNLDWQSDPKRMASSVQKSANTRRGRPIPACRQYYWDTDIFKKVDSDAFAAYLYGIIATDGSVKDTSISLQVGSKDRDWLGAIAKRFGVPVHLYNGYPHIALCSVVAAQDLISMGVVPNKTVDTRELYIPEKWQDFMRGLIDGDGCISIDIADNRIAVSFGSTNKWLTVWVGSKFKEYGWAGKVHDVSKQPHQRHHPKPYQRPFYQVQVGCSRAKDFLADIYYQGAFALPRKAALSALAQSMNFKRQRRSYGG